MVSDEWILRVKLKGEWEECRYPSAREALNAISALARDYSEEIPQAVVQLLRSRPAPKRREYIN